MMTCKLLFFLPEIRYIFSH